MQQYIYTGVKKIDRNIEIKSKSANLTFPPGVKLEGVTFEYPHGLREKIEAENLKITAGIISLFLLKPEVDIDSEVFGGEINFSLALNGGKKIESGTCSFNDFEIEKIITLFENALKGYSLKGQISGNGKWTSVSRKTEGMCSISVRNLLIKLDKPFFSVVAGATFNEISADFEYKSGVLKLLKCNLKGLETDGNVTGTIMIRKPIERSNINLSGVILPKRNFLKAIDKKIPVSIETLIGEKRYRKGSIPFRITGRISKPKFSMR